MHREVAHTQHSFDLKPSSIVVLCVPLLGFELSCTFAVFHNGKLGRVGVC